MVMLMKHFGYFFSLRTFFFLLPSLLIFSVNTHSWSCQRHRGIAACYFSCLQRNAQTLIRTLCWSEIISCSKGDGLMEHLLGICRIVCLSLSLIKDKTFLKESKLREKVSGFFFFNQKLASFFSEPSCSFGLHNILEILSCINTYPCLISEDMKSDTMFYQWVGSETQTQTPT